MRAVKLVIPGQWWDSLIYAGHLYLFDRNGDVRVINWQRMIERWPIADELGLPMLCSFARGDSLYGARWKPVVEDPEIQAVLVKRFDRLGRHKLIASSQQIEENTKHQASVGFSFPYGDIAAYGGRLWIASPEGLEASTFEERPPLAVDSDRVWDCPLLSLSPSYGTMALAAGDEGMFEFRIDSARDRDPHRTIDGNCTACEWLYYSVYASSHLEPAQLAAYRRYFSGRDTETGRRQYEREYDRTVVEEELFPAPGANSSYSWGSADKIYKSTDDGIAATRYMPGHPDPDKQFESLGIIARPKAAEVIVSARVAMFGVVVELPDSLLILRSDGRQRHLDGAPINWRVFPRSNWYLNQLHAVYEDRLEVWSFNHDFLLDQEAKETGIRYRERAPMPRGSARPEAGG